MQFSCSICVAMISAILKLEHPWTHKSWRAENLYSDRFGHGGIWKSHLKHAEMKSSKAMPGFCCPIFEMLGQSFLIAKGSKW